MITAILFISLILLFILDTPFAIAIGLAAIFALFAMDESLLIAMQRMYAGVNSFPLLAVPLFILAGNLMKSGGMAKRITDLAKFMVGKLPGGIGIVSIVGSMFFAGISGSAAADTAAIGSILIPAMLSQGYSKGFACSVEASSGSIGVVIPPSIPMIIFAFLTGVSVSELFAAGILPGILIGFSLIFLVMFIAPRNSKTTQIIPVKLGNPLAYIPALIAPIIILGGIFSGIFTATEAAAVAVFYAIAVGLFVYRELKLKDLKDIFLESAVTSSLVLFIIAAATSFSWIMAIEQIPQQIATGLLSLTSNKVVLLLLINLMLLIAGTFLETTAALILFTPVIASMAPILEMNLVQLGVIVVVNLAIGMLTPPLGICLIVATSIAGTKLETVTQKILPFLLILIIDLLLITFWEPLTMWLPKTLL
jgi:tripartite ATP-independent transporter DctM subunit